MTIGQRIKKKREELEMTQDELARLVGYKSRSSVNKIELGHYNLTQTKIKAFADALGVSPLWLLGLDDERERDDRQIRDLIAQHYGEDAARIVAYYLLLEPDDRRVVNDLIQSLLRGEKYLEKVETLPA